MDQSMQLLESAKGLLQQGRLQESEAAFHQVVSSGQYVAEGFYGVGLVRLNLNDLDGAAYHFKNALQCDPRHANALYQLGVIAERQQSWQEALLLHENVLAMNPQHRGAREALGQLYSRLTPSSTPHTDKKIMGPVARVAPPQQYGAYEYLLQDTSMLSRQTIAVMDFLRDSVGRGHPSETAYLSTFIGLIIGICIIFFILVSANTIQEAQYDTLFALLVLVGLPPLALFLIVRGLYRFLYIWTTDFILDKGRLQVERGILRRQLLNVELWRVHTIELKQTFFNRLTGDGTLVFRLEHEQTSLEVKGLAQGTQLKETYQQLLNLVALLRSNPVVKGIIQ
jgi:hypothetical protein